MVRVESEVFGGLGRFYEKHLLATILLAMRVHRHETNYFQEISYPIHTSKTCLDEWGLTE